MTPLAASRLKGAVVEVIRQLWDRGLYRQNSILCRIHDNWFEYWVELRTSVTMRDVDRQIEEINREASSVSMITPIYSETLEGDTALGGEMRIQSRFIQEDK